MGMVPLHIHSEYSLLESSCRIKELVSRAKSLGYKALAISDKLNMYGVIPFYKECVKQDIQPVIGLEVNVLLTPGENHLKPAEIAKLLFYAKNQKGYENLLQMSSLLLSNPSYREPYLQKETIFRHKEGLIAISSGIEGEIQQLILRNKKERLQEVLELYKEWFKEDFYLGLEDHGSGKERMLNLELVKLSRANGIPPVVSNEIYYLKKEDAQAHDILLCIKNGQKITEQNRTSLPGNEFYLKSEEELFESFEYVQEAIDNTRKIAASCQLNLAFGQKLLPEYPLPPEVSASDYLRKLCLNNVKERYSHVSNAVRERLDYELSVIDKMGFADYFLIVWDFMKFAHESGMITGPGRGSAAGSLVAYVLYITDVDPLQHELLFERFLNPERVTMPDIDIDFPDTRRDEVLQYVASKYGRDRVAQIITFGTLAAKAAVRDAGRVMNLPASLIDSVSKQIPSRPGMSLNQAIEESPGLKKLITESKEVKALMDIAMSLQGLPRHVSTHAAGVIISGKPLTDIVPVQSGHDGISLTQYSMEWLEEIGLLKMDFLGLRNLSLIETICTLIESGTGKKIDLKSIPFNDQATFELLSLGDTTGVFQLESDGMRRVLQQLKPTEFEDIVAVNALYRPGPMQNIPTYIAVKHGKKNVQYLHPDLEPILRSTHGVIVYQEQIMKIASTMAGFSLGEADLLRRAVGKKKREILDRERTHFVTGCLNKGYDEKTANDLYDLIVRFADYGFPRSHAVAYSVIAYQLAYLKANFPLYFMAALLSSVIGNADKVEQYVKECKEKNIRVLPPSILHSHSYFSVEGNNIRFGLLCIKNVGHQAIGHLIRERKKQPFKDLFDVCAHSPAKMVNKRTLESLIFAGAMDDFGIDRASLIATLDTAIEYGETVQNAYEENQMRLFNDRENMKKPSYIEVPPFSETERLRFEHEALGFYLTGHPIEKFTEKINQLGAITVRDAVQFEKKVMRMAVMIIKTRIIKTKKGDMMAFLTGSDETGELEMVAFPEQYHMYHPLLQKGEFLLLEGKIETRGGSAQLVIQKAARLEEINIQKKPTLYLKIREQSTDHLNKLKSLLENSKGNTEVVLYYEVNRKTVKLKTKIHISQTLLYHIKELIGKENVALKEQ
ncbi:DNA polymerase III subunit alpha [Fictibacillus gelatini]|uniref:DNA polymerase III subunit alpha n=1 Tax=Fictibacillus gelatini TaxID=225985 RepID=UPI0004203323|nr:DNA polymerase III subunit alpha [Fictibacillus gelatini]